MKVISISPSGNFYGSEQVLFDYLLNTSLEHILFVPKGSQFEKLLNEQVWKHRIKSFQPKRLRLFYLYLSFFILFHRIKTVYWNEGGHVRWSKFLAFFFRSRRMVLHIRMIYDANAQRIGSIPSNMKLLAISNFVAANLIKLNMPVEVLYDGFNFQLTQKIKPSTLQKLKIGVIGRVSKTKGVEEIYKLNKELNIRSISGLVQIYLFGEVFLNGEDLERFNSFVRQHSNVTYEGFKSTNEVYRNLDVVLHLNKDEGLGRIYLEAVSRGIPFVGIDSAGISEIGEVLGLKDFLVNPNEGDYIESLTDILLYIKNNYEIAWSKTLSCQDKLRRFEIKSYTKKIDSILKHK